jgi:hypothetical protein
VSSCNDLGVSVLRGRAFEHSTGLPTLQTSPRYHSICLRSW